MIKKVTKKSFAWECDYLHDGEVCGKYNRCAPDQVKPIDPLTQTALTPRCEACGCIRVLNLQDPLAQGPELVPHPGYAPGHHTPAAMELIHGQALLALLAGKNPIAVYKQHGA